MDSLKDQLKHAYPEVKKRNNKRVVGYHDKIKVLSPVMEIGEDGETHINIYNKALTTLGKFLSHASEYSIKHSVLAKFNSMEGLWMYVSSLERNERLRYVTGNNLKKISYKMKRRKVPNFKAIIMDSNYQKIMQYEYMYEAFRESTLPFDLYYFKDSQEEEGLKLRIRPEYYKWLVASFEEIRRAIQADRKPDFDWILDVKNSGVYDFIFNKDEIQLNLNKPKKQKTPYVLPSNTAGIVDNMNKTLEKLRSNNVDENTEPVNKNTLTNAERENAIKVLEDSETVPDIKSVPEAPTETEADIAKVNEAVKEVSDALDTITDDKLIDDTIDAMEDVAASNTESEVAETAETSVETVADIETAAEEVTVSEVAEEVAETTEPVTDELTETKTKTKEYSAKESEAADKVKELADAIKEASDTLEGMTDEEKELSAIIKSLEEGVDTGTSTIESVVDETEEAPIETETKEDSAKESEVVDVNEEVVEPTANNEAPKDHPIQPPQQ